MFLDLLRSPLLFPRLNSSIARPSQNSTRLGLKSTVTGVNPSDNGREVHSLTDAEPNRPTSVPGLVAHPLTGDVSPVMFAALVRYALIEKGMWEGEGSSVGWGLRGVEPLLITVKC